VNLIVLQPKKKLLTSGIRKVYRGVKFEFVDDDSQRTLFRFRCYSHLPVHFFIHRVDFLSESRIRKAWLKFLQPLSGDKGRTKQGAHYTQQDESRGCPTTHEPNYKLSYKSMQ
jgi:hypothetical protein